MLHGNHLMKIYWSIIKECAIKEYFYAIDLHY